MTQDSYDLGQHGQFDSGQIQYHLVELILILMY